MFALYWDESDPDDDVQEKIRRAIYNTFEEAKMQADHDLLCLRCRVLEDGRYTLKSTGKDPLDPDKKKKCPDCGGSKMLASKNILYIEELEYVDKRNLNHGKKVWEREKE